MTYASRASRLSLYFHPETIIARWEPGPAFEAMQEPPYWSYIATNAKSEGRVHIDHLDQGWQAHIFIFDAARPAETIPRHIIMVPRAGHQDALQEAIERVNALIKPSVGSSGPTQSGL